ncbi:MAG: Uma2 family endonuclease [Chromatiaceae bacterium]|nr:Uma2 family endonuclease [Chromatiaceae bacterium]
MTLPTSLLQASELGIRLEIVNGLAIWEAQPLYRHQKAIDRIARSLRGPDGQTHGCGCIDALDVYIQFASGLKRPDLSIFCQEPPEDQQDQVLTLVPEAVVEVVSKGFEARDLEIGPPFYLSQGVKDVVVFDPATLLVLHVRKDGVSRQVSPVEIELECGCRLTV